MISEWDTHYWIGYTGGKWISQEDLDTTADERFSCVQKLWIVPISELSFQASLRVERPKGYTLFFRHRPYFKDDPSNIFGVEYILACGRGSWTPLQAASLNIDDWPALLDGFRVTLGLDGGVNFGGKGWTYEKSSEEGVDVYTFVREIDHD